MTSVNILSMNTCYVPRTAEDVKTQADFNKFVLWGREGCMLLTDVYTGAVDARRKCMS